MTDLETTLSAITRMAEEVKDDQRFIKAGATLVPGGLESILAAGARQQTAAPALADAVLALVEVARAAEADRQFAKKYWGERLEVTDALSRLSTLKETRG